MAPDCRNMSQEACPTSNRIAGHSYAAEVARRLLCGEFDLEDPEFDAIEDDDEP